MRGTPGGKHPTEFSVVGFTGSFESSKERGPNDGRVALNFSSAQGVIGGSVALNDQDKYRVAGEDCMFHTPERSGVAAAGLGARVAWADKSAGRADIHAKESRVFIFFPSPFNCP